MSFDDFSLADADDSLNDVSALLATSDLTRRFDDVIGDADFDSDRRFLTTTLGVDE